MSAASISESTRDRRARRTTASSGSTSVVVTGYLERIVGIVGHGVPPVLRDEQHLLGPVARRTVLPDDRFDHEHHPCGEHERGVERLADVTPDVRHFGTVDAET